MRFVTYSEAPSKSQKIGVIVRDGTIIDLQRAARRARVELPFPAHDMIALIAAGRKGLAAVKKTVAGIKTGDRALEGAVLHAPIPHPVKNVFCVGWNYVEHFEEGAESRPHMQDMPAHPAFFTKAPTTVIGPYDVIPLHAGVTEKLDWEVELAVVIGKGGKNITEDRAMTHIFGYMVANDVSAREIQRQHGQQWFKGKSLDGTCPMGPWIVTRDEIPYPDHLRLTCRVNGIIKQDSNTSRMYFKIPRIIAELSAGLTLSPGDIILTGTPAGVGHARMPPEFMKAGDLLESEIAGLGVLRNRIGN